MIRLRTAALGVAACAALAACSTEPSAPAAADVYRASASARDTTGNGAPSGAHYTLNIIGVANPKTAEMDSTNRHVIFVPLSGQAKIYLGEGDFQVIDGNGTDQDGAKFMLPNPDENMDGTTSYSVYVRALGKPNGKAWMQSCYTDTTGTWCALDFAGGVDSVQINRTKGQSKFTNVSKDLLYVDYCTNWTAGTDGVLGTSDDVCTSTRQIPLFSDDELGYLWEYNNQGLRVAQLRFYEGVETITGWTP